MRPQPCRDLRPPPAAHLHRRNLGSVAQLQGPFCSRGTGDPRDGGSWDHSGDNHGLPVPGGHRPQGKGSTPCPRQLCRGRMPQQPGRVPRGKAGPGEHCAGGRCPKDTGPPPRFPLACPGRGVWARSRGTSAGSSGGNGIGKAPLGLSIAFVSIINFPFNEEGGSETHSPLSPWPWDPASSPGRGGREQSPTSSSARLPSRLRCQLDAAAPFLSEPPLAAVRLS